ncbi:MAG: GNAT family N-acetyltransferase [Rhizobiaceae bacterium]
MAAEYQIRVLASLDQIEPDQWNQLSRQCAGLNKDSPPKPANPFLSHEFLYALEKSGSADASTGWLGRHLILESDDGIPIGALPCYLKNHSQGEYVFDHGWADAFMRAGGNYYPKLQCCIPFTPATGPRLLVPEGANSDASKMALAQGLRQLTERHGASSAHITFIEEEGAGFFESQGYLRRTDQQFHWHNRDFKDFDDFLASLSSRKRKNIRKERITALQSGELEIIHLSGDQLTEEVWDIFFQFYTDTGSRKWGQPYLTREFYSLIGQSMADQILLVMVKREGRYVAGAINFVGDDCLYGRHWGCIEDHPLLHFEVCYYQAIEYAIIHNLARVEAGAQGDHKLSRGYEPVTTHSAHWIAHPGLRDAVEDYLQTERQHVQLENEALRAHSPFKKES